MSKELKTGDKITCFIEQKLPNCLVVRFQNGKAGSGNSTSVFRGVLIDESSPVTKRVLSSSPITSKPRLTKEFTTTFIENFNSKNSSGKALRNKNPSCLVLDDFCIDYHNTCPEKPEKRKQYLQPKGVAAHGGDKNGNTEKGKVDMECEGKILSRGSEDGTDPSMDKEKRLNALGKTEVPLNLSNCSASDAVLQKDSCLAKEIVSEQVENRYSKRSRSEKPKRFFGSEFDLHPGFDKKSPNKTMIDENRKKEPSLAPKPKSKEEGKDKRAKDKLYEKRDTKDESISSHENVNATVKRSARIQLKRSKQDDNKLDAISGADELSNELQSSKRKKLDASKNEITSSPKSHSRNSIQNRDDKERKSENSSANCRQSNHRKPTAQNEGTKCQSFAANEKGIDIQKSTRNKAQKAAQSSKMPDKKRMHQKSSEAYLLKQKSASVNESSHERGQVNVCNEANGDKANDDDFLLCHEPALNDDFDCLQNYHKKLAVLMQAETILGGKITLLSQNDNIELEKPGRDTFSQSQPPTAKVESIQTFKINSKSRDLAAASKIIIDRGKGIVSIQPSPLNDRGGDKQGEQISESILSDDGNQSDNKHESNSVFIVINRRPQGMAQDTQFSRVEVHETEAERSKEKICSSVGDGKMKNMAAPKEGSCSQASSIEGGQKTIKDDADSDLNRRDNNMESIYAKLSFNRLLASVHEEATKANLRTVNVASGEKFCAIRNVINPTVVDVSISDKIQEPCSGAPSISESSTQLKNPDVKKCTNELREDDLICNLTESRASDRISKYHSHSLKESIISSKDENDHALVGNASTHGDITSTLCTKDEQACRLKDDHANLGLERQGETVGKESKVCQTLLDALRALKTDANGTTTKSSPQSGAILPSSIHRQDDVSSPQSTLSSESKTDFRLTRRRNASLFKAKTAGQQHPSFGLISGLRNIEQKMAALSRGQQTHLMKYSLLRNIDSIEASNFTKHNTLPGNEVSRNENDIAVVKLDVDCKSSLGDKEFTCNDSCNVKENLREEKCKIAEDIKSSPFLEGVQNHESCTSKQRRKSLKPMKNSSVLRTHPEKSLTHPVLSKNVQAKLLQFDGKKTVTRSRGKSDSKMVGQESEGKAWNTSENEVKRWCGETLATVYSLGKVRKSYKHTKRGARKYPVPSRSSIRRNPRYCWKVLGKAYSGKEDSEGPSCDLMTAKKPSAAREQGEELLKEILKLNKGILIKQDF